MSVQVVMPDEEEAVRNQRGFVHVSKYGSLQPMQGEIGSISGVRFVASEFDPVIAERRNQIRMHCMNRNVAIPPMQAECAVMGHVRFGEKSDCFYCGAHWE